ncbi:MAG: GIY-YIG nuclease family protein [Gracilibacteraceae bacterium]|jgi:putative endonuclease|nr:GIY-YIG nuclease family protein [Gracilibacteraceae bacterium]
MYFVYMAQCRDGSLYTGITDDVARRIMEHNSGRGAKYTRGRGPLRLCYVEETESRGSALRREREIKALRRADKLLLAERCRQASEHADFGGEGMDFAVPVLQK